MNESIKKQLLESADLKQQLADKYCDIISEIAGMCVKSIESGGKIMFCGNGGSAADCQHLATELVVRLTGDYDRRALPALALTTNTSILTASANDYGFDQVFARQAEALGKPNDVLIAISTSGNSANVIKAVQSANAKQIQTIGLTGKDGGELASLVNKALLVPSDDVARIQEAHITIGHIIISLIERELK